jgi:hypothetical protein
VMQSSSAFAAARTSSILAGDLPLPAVFRAGRLS